MASEWSSDKKHSDRERWVCIYPVYINSKKTLFQGRRIAKDKCVENPTHQEMKDVLATTGLKFGVENKLHPRERSKEMIYKGRIRVQLKNDDGNPIDNDFPTRDSILLHLCNMIPKLKSRASKQGGSDQNTQGGGSSQSSSSKKKGKGRR